MRRLSESASTLAPRRSTLGLCAWLLVPFTFGCDGCVSEDFSPQGAIEPAVLDLGPVLGGESCEAGLTITNRGGSELSIDGAELRDSSGDYALPAVIVNSVGIDGDEPLLVNYTATATDGSRESVTVVLFTNDPDDDGEISATITAIATDEAGAIARLQCENDDATAFVDCGGELNMGAVNIQDPIQPIDMRAGLTAKVLVENRGNAPMELRAVTMNGGNPDFTIQGIQQGDVLVDLPITLEPGTGSCGVVNEGAASTAEISVFYSPTALGADADTLLVLTDAIEGATLELPVTGLGSDIGILLTPPTVVFDDIAEGQTTTATMNVSNLGTNDAAVNSTCIDLDGDETCDFDCTGDEPGLGGTLNCDVTYVDGSNEGKGFILAPTDAMAGGNDERTVTFTWSPTAENPAIPGTAVVRYESAILNNRVWTARIIGGAAGNLTFDGLGNTCPGGNGVCIPATGDAADVTTWTGELDFALGNDGDATISITRFAWEGPPTIADDYELYQGDTPVNLEAPGVDIAPGGSQTFTIVYANDDASGADAINLIVTHTGVNLMDTIPVNVTPVTE
jgi:hypothetical protein